MLYTLRVGRFEDLLTNGPVAQLVRAPPCHGGGRRFDPDPGRLFCSVGLQNGKLIYFVCVGS